MKTVFTALAAASGCTAARWYLERSSRREVECLGGWVRLKSLWNEGAAFGLPVPFPSLAEESAGSGADFGRGPEQPGRTGPL